MLKFNRETFQTINTPEECYWLGFITADGYIPLNSSNNPKGVRLKLQDSDKTQIEKFIKFMGGKTEDFIKNEKHNLTEKNLWYCQFYSTKVGKALLKLNIANAKSGNEIYLNNLPYQRDYIRGLIDGDGFITTGRPGVGLVGSYDICENVQKYFQNKLLIKPLKIHKHGVIYKIEYNAQNDVRKILKHLYQEGDVGLDRKIKLVEKIC